jgi:hypothetical protein
MTPVADVVIPDVIRDPEKRARSVWIPACAGMTPEADVVIPDLIRDPGKRARNV